MLLAEMEMTLCIYIDSHYCTQSDQFIARQARIVA